MAGTIRFFLFIGIALAGAGCAASYVPVEIPGYHPTVGERLESHLVFPDMAASRSFATEICRSNLLSPSPYVLKTSSGVPSLALRTTIVPTTTQNSPARDLTGNPLYSAGSASVTDKTGKTQTIQGKQASDSTTTSTATSSDASSPIVTTCSLKVIATAVSLCSYKTLGRTALAQLENNGFYAVLGLSGVAAGAAALAHASGTTTTLVAGATAGLTTMFTQTQKTVPTAGSAQPSGILNAGLGYLVLDNSINMKNGPDQNGPYHPWVATAAIDPPASGSAEFVSYGDLFNVSISACTQSVT
ncbi:MAG: hypothetical protein ACREHF_11905 [Rhizomicrobium sp.]